MTDRIKVDLDELRSWAGIGVAGNVAGHMEQAGEAAAGAEPQTAPKGIFPFYVPDADSFHGVFPLSTSTICWPDGETNVQIEPELALACELGYDADGLVESVTPFAFGAQNDCSIRRPGGKLAAKKNWGPSSQGVSSWFLPLDRFDSSGATAPYRLAGFLVQENKAEAYTCDSPLTSYLYYGQQLIDWLLERLRNQKESPDGQFENVAELLRAGQPARALVCIGATKYTELGASEWLEPGDRSVVVVYDGSLYSPDEVEGFVQSGDYPTRNISVIDQLVRR